MNFKSLKINGFGKLSKKEFELKPGINIIYGENEAGKSSLLKFLTSMLYGVSKNKNGKSIADFEKYKPWNDSEFSGALEYNLDSGESFEIYREFKKKSPSIYDGHKNDITKNFKENKSKGIAFFEEQTGIDEETYLSTAIIEQEEVKLDRSSQNVLVQKISNKVSSGDDNVSYKKTLATITKLQGEKVGTDRTQNKPINLVDAEIRKLESKKNELEEIKEAQGSDDTELEKFKKNIEEAEKEKEEKIKQLSENTIAYEPSDIEYKNPVMSYIIASFLFIISIFLLIFVHKKIVGLIVLLLAIIFNVRIFVQYKENRSKIKDMHDENNKAKEECVKNLTRQIKEKEEAIEKMKKNLYEIEFCRKSDDKLLEELPSIVQKLDELYVQKSELESLNNSYNIAKECLEIAYEEVKKNISPRFTDELCKNISVITDNRYNFVKVTDDEGLVIGLENGNYISADRLSIGTIDQLYLSLRLSAIKEITNEKIPIILDEAFAYFDDERLNNILKYLSSEYKDYQILIFTCSQREKALLDANNIEYNLINLEK